ncbi:hypothetical protein XELAEV_18009223mg [Xenopus laevis]|uniref:Uncharacterized protein n=1 Tax=Xenopus laevis TaxID=8355 RepID=A0A974DUD6_XENLA|nr:hypothetical protein XELAEV_18009223mg [Xenopus laevis]
MGNKHISENICPINTVICNSDCRCLLPLALTNICFLLLLLYLPGVLNRARSISKPFWLCAFCLESSLCPRRALYYMTMKIFIHPGHGISSIGKSKTTGLAE